LKDYRIYKKNDLEKAAERVVEAVKEFNEIFQTTEEFERLSESYKQNALLREEEIIENPTFQLAGEIGQHVKEAFTCTPYFSYIVNVTERMGQDLAAGRNYNLTSCRRPFSAAQRAMDKGLITLESIGGMTVYFFEIDGEMTWVPVNYPYVDYLVLQAFPYEQLTIMPNVEPDYLEEPIWISRVDEYPDSVSCFPFLLEALAPRIERYGVEDWEVFIGMECEPISDEIIYRLFPDHYPRASSIQEMIKEIEEMRDKWRKLYGEESWQVRRMGLFPDTEAPSGFSITYIPQGEPAMIDYYNLIMFTRRTRSPLRLQWFEPGFNWAHLKKVHAGLQKRGFYHQQTISEMAETHHIDSSIGDEAYGIGVLRKKWRGMDIFLDFHPLEMMGGNTNYLIHDSKNGTFWEVLGQNLGVTFEDLKEAVVRYRDNPGDVSVSIYEDFAQILLQEGYIVSAVKDEYSILEVAHFLLVRYRKQLVIKRQGKWEYHPLLFME
jgi:hypothetical protein